MKEPGFRLLTTRCYQLGIILETDGSHSRLWFDQSSVRLENPFAPDVRRCAARSPAFNRPVHPGRWLSRKEVQSECFSNRVRFTGTIGSNPFCTPPLESGRWPSIHRRKRVYLQHVPLRKSVPQSLVDQYLSLDHPLLIPHRQVFQESKALVFVRPYLPLDGLVYRCPADEETAMAWCDQLAKLEAYLKNQPHPMQIVYVPENIGLTDQGELRVFLCGDASYMRWDFSDRETFRRILIGEKGTGKASPELEEARKGRSRKWVWGMGVALLLCMVAGFGLLKFLQKPGEKPVQAEPEPPRQVEADPESEPVPEPAPETSTEAAPPTQEDMDRSQAAAEEFIFSLDQDKYQRILKKKNRP